MGHSILQGNWLCVFLLLSYTPIKQKPKQLGNKLGKFTFFILLCFTIHLQGSVHGVYLVKCSSKPYLKMSGL